MNKRIIIVLALITLFSFTFYKEVFSWTEGTHRNFSEYAAESSVLDKNNGDYLRNLGFTKGLKEFLKWGDDNKEIKDWLATGAELEDKKDLLFPLFGTTRSFNHFHNPLRSWDNAGLDDTAFGKSYTGQSSLLWAQDGANQENFPGGDWSWQRIREYYYLALTSTTDAERQEYFAMVFRGLGHQMHLIQDAAQPDHVRNDAHPEDTLGLTYGIGFEKWAGENPAFINSLASNPIFPEVALNLSYSGLVPITQFLDTEQYDGTNPSVSLAQGIAEYTNANFFSDDTIFAADELPADDRHYFPYPKKSSTNLQEYIDQGLLPETIIAEDGVEDVTFYISKVKDGETVERFLKPSYLSGDILSLLGETDIYYRSFYRDERCHEDYASLLIPRAVGYSAGLLDYFFRGKIDIIWDDDIGRYRIVNLSDEEMEGNLGFFKLFYDDIDNNRYEIPLTFYDESGNQYTDPNAILTIPAQADSTFTVDFTYSSNIKTFILVFRGRLGDEDDAVVGRVINNTLYFVIFPGDPVTREGIDKRFYSLTIGSDIPTAINEADLPFEVVDDGGYWDEATSSWTATNHPDSLGVPLSTGGPQYMAKFWDDANNRVRVVLNGSYEKNAYVSFHKIYTDEAGLTIKDFHYLVFTGSPILRGDAYEENPGYMEYREDTDNPGTYGVYSLRPIPAVNPLQPYFSGYNSNGFFDSFYEYDSARFYRLDGTVDIQQVPMDADAPYPSVVAVSRTGDGYNVKIPRIFNNYIRPNPYWTEVGYGASGIDDYTALIGSPMVYTSSELKCTSEDDNCGNIYWEDEGSSNETVFDIPYNFNSFVRVHNNDGGRYYEELFINGQKIKTSAISTTQLETHYQILAVYKDIAVIRETNFVSFNSVSLDYAYAHPGAPGVPTARVVKDEWDFTARYYIYVKGMSYDLSGLTSIKTKLLDTIEEAFSPPYPPIVNYLTWEAVEDITGYHLDRIFISESFDGEYILVAFDEYVYNSGAGLVHDLKYEESDLQDGRYFLYYSIPPDEIQRASHEALPVGRRLLLFRSDGSLVNNLQDPIGLDYFIGSIGILN